MHGVTTAGPYFLTAVVAQGSRLVRNNRARMASRKKRKSRGTKRSSRRR